MELIIHSNTKRNYNECINNINANSTLTAQEQRIVSIAALTAEGLSSAAVSKPMCQTIPAKGKLFYISFMACL